MTTALLTADKKASAPADKKASAPWNEAETEGAVRRFLAADETVRNGKAMAEKGRWLRAEIAQEAYQQSEATFDVFSQGVNRSTTWLSDCAATARIFPTKKDRYAEASCRDHFRAQRKAGKFPEGDTDEGRRKIALHWLKLKNIKVTTMDALLEEMEQEAARLHEEAEQKRIEEQERKRRKQEAKEVEAEDALMIVDALLTVTLKDKARKVWLQNLGELLGQHMDRTDIAQLGRALRRHGLTLREFDPVEEDE